MADDLDDLRQRIDLDEINYPKLARELGSQALPGLATIAQDPNVGLASKAIYLASVISGADAAAILETAALHPNPTVRVAAAAGLRNLDPAHAERGADPLLEDEDASVRKVALHSAIALDSPGMAARVKRMADEDSDPVVREAARSALPEGP
jgi:HEAT repeat protein